MSRPRRPPGDWATIRPELIARARRQIESHGTEIRVGDALFVSPFPRLLEALEADETVEVDLYLVPRWARPPSHAGRVRIDANGSVHPCGFVSAQPRSGEGDGSS